MFSWFSGNRNEAAIKAFHAECENIAIRGLNAENLYKAYLAQLEAAKTKIQDSGCSAEELAEFNAECQRAESNLRELFIKLNQCADTLLKIKKNINV